MRVFVLSCMLMYAFNFTGAFAHASYPPPSLVDVGVRACMGASVYVSACVCVRMSVCMCKGVCTSICVHASAHVGVGASVHACMRALVRHVWVWVGVCILPYTPAAT